MGALAQAGLVRGLARAAAIEGLLSGRRSGRAPFTDYGLITDPATSFLLDPSDYTSMRQERSLVLSSAAAGSPVGNMLSKAAMAGLSASDYIVAQANLLTNGDFSTGDLTGWTVHQGEASVTGGVARVRTLVTAEYGRLLQSLVTEDGIAYVLAGDIVYADGANRAFIYRSDDASGEVNREDLHVVATTPRSGSTFITGKGLTSYIRLEPDSSANEYADFDNISLKKLPGTRRARAGSADAYRPVLQTGPDRLVFDGVDDRLETTLYPNPNQGTIAVRMLAASANKIAIGAASSNRCYIGMNSGSKLGAGIGASSFDVITGGGSIANTEITGIVTWNSGTAKLYLNGVEIYSDSYLNSPDNTRPFFIGAYNNAGTASLFHSGYIRKAEILPYAITAAQAANLHTLWSAAS